MSESVKQIADLHPTSGFLKHVEKIVGYLRYAKNYSSASRAAAYYGDFLRNISDVGGLISCPMSEASVLILGCGYKYPDVVLFSNSSKSVVGIDIIHAFYRDGIVRTLQDVGLLKALLERYETYGFYDKMQELSGKPVRHKTYNLVSYDGTAMPFEDETFDLVLSSSVFEHIQDLETSIKEVFRVTKRHGISYHRWHNYYSLSGGHAPPSMALKYPWGHLRGKYQMPYLNKCTPSEVYQLFSRHFRDVQLHQGKCEHKELLTEDIRQELQAFPAELLLTTGYWITGRKT